MHTAHTPIHSGPTGHGDVPQLPGVEVANLHGEGPDAYAVLLRRGGDDVDCQWHGHAFGSCLPGQLITRPEPMAHTASTSNGTAIVSPGITSVPSRRVSNGAVP